MFIAEASSADLGTLFVILAFIGFAAALYLAYVGNFVGAAAAALIAILILLFA